MKDFIEQLKDPKIASIFFSNVNLIIGLIALFVSVPVGCILLFLFAAIDAILLVLSHGLIE